MIMRSREETLAKCSLEHLDEMYQFAQSLVGDAARSERAVEEAYAQARKAGADIGPGPEGRTLLFSYLIPILERAASPWGRWTRWPWRSCASPPADPVLRVVRQMPAPSALMLLLVDVWDYEITAAAELVGRGVEEAKALLADGRQQLEAILYRPPAVTHPLAAATE